MLSNMRQQHIRRWPPAWKGKLSCPLVVAETKVKSLFLLWHHHGNTSTAFQLKLPNSLVTQLLYDFVANNLINFKVIEIMKQHFICFKILFRLLLWGFDVQFEPTKALQPDSSSDENWETCSSADSEPNATTWKEASADAWYMCFNCIKC